MGAVNQGETRVTAAELVRQFGKWQDHAASRPIFVTHHGRDRFVLQTAGSYQALQARSTRRGPPAAETLFEQMSEGFIAFDAAYRVTALNAPAAAYLRLSRESAIGINLSEHESFRKSLIFAQLDRTMRSGAFGGFDAPSPVFPDRWLAVRSFSYGDGAACLLRDVTEMVIERRAAEEAEAMQAALAAHDGIGRAWLSPRGTFIRVNAVLVGMLGLESAALLGARLIDVLPLAARAEVREASEAVLMGGEPRSLATTLLSNEGGELPVRLALAAYRDDRGERGAVAIMTVA